MLAATLMLASCGGGPERPRGAGRAGHPASDLPVKIGAPYRVGGRTYVPVDDRNYDAVGTASWYGPGFRGGLTANGERFRADGISGAHTTLPLPSYVEVTSLANGRRILVRINDRGPFAAGRVIDLSRGAARLLGMEQAGVARVRVRRVFPSEAERRSLRSGRAGALLPDASPQQIASLRARGVASASAARPALPPASIYIQVASLSDRARAERLANEFGGAVVPIGSLNRVRIGPFADAEAAQPALAHVRTAGYQDAALVRDAGVTLSSSMEIAR